MKFCLIVNGYLLCSPVHSVEYRNTVTNNFFFLCVFQFDRRRVNMDDSDDDF